jgi:hypothetical protein
LGQRTFSAWRRNREAKEARARLLLLLLAEMEQNWSILRNAYYGSVVEVLEVGVYGAASKVLRAMLKKQFLEDEIVGAYANATQGLAITLKGGANQNRTAAVLAAWSGFGKAANDLRDFMTKHRIRQYSLTGDDCKYRDLEALVDGFPLPIRQSILIDWRTFLKSAEARQVRWVRLRELGGRDPYVADILADLSLRSEVVERGVPAAFQLSAQIWEIVLEPTLRLLFAIGYGGNLVLLDIVQLGGPEQQGPTPRRFVERAGCRFQNQ